MARFRRLFGRLVLASALGLWCTADALADSPASDAKEPSLAGRTLCEAESLLGVYSDFRAPFAKDPSSTGFASIRLPDRHASMIVALSLRGDPNCPEILAAMRLDYSFEQHPGDTLSFNCAVLHQTYDRHKSYLAVFTTNDLEYTRAKRAWTFDFVSRRFAPYKRVENVYCPNFIAD